jgi:predicted dehydrogenase
VTLKIGICGAGYFASWFLPLFQAHPGVSEVAIAEVDPDRRASVAAEFGIARAFSSLEELCASDVDAVAIFTQRWMHGPQAAYALAAGKHVYSAVPMGITIEELTTIIDLAESTGLVYSMGETSYYYPAALYCRERFARGDLGAFVYGEGEYLHDMSQGFYEVFERGGGTGWKATASFPPMLYPSHSVSIVLSVTGERMTDAVCLGYRDQQDDGVFRAEVSRWGNDLSNETALFRTSGGGIVRINEMRRVGIPKDFVRVGLFGTDATFEEAGRRQFWIERTGRIEEVTDQLRCGPAPSPGESRGGDSILADDFFSGTSSVHPVERLPAEFATLSSGHYGSHQFLVDDFVRACRDGDPVPVGPRVAASYCAPGIVAHASARQGGERLIVPDFTVA